MRRKMSISKKIRDVLYNSVQVHMRSDVPVGSFFCQGGIDSSIIASIAKEFNPNLLTFSVGFEREGFSEVDVAKETAEKAAGEKNYNVNVTPEEYMKEFPKKSFGIWMILLQIQRLFLCILLLGKLVSM
ncbi:hypothetical protein GCM10020331_064460 [Ectobacillus funiculus]